MNDTPPVSVVMGVLNGLPHLEASVRSVLAQSFADFEFVIGDDGSSDGSSAYLRSIAAEDPRVRLLRRASPSGLAGSANWVVGASRAPLVAMMHADDLSHPERLARQVSLLRTQPDVQLVGSLANGIDERGRLVRKPDYWRLTRASAFAPFAHTSIMFRRPAFERVGGYRAEAEYWEDLDLYLRMAELGRISVIPEALVSMRSSPASARLRNDVDRVDEAIDRMYRSLADYVSGGAYPRAFPPLAEPGEKLEPETFIGRGSVQLWSGRSPRLFKRMMRRAAFRADWFSPHVLLWTLWSTLSPRTMRFALGRVADRRSRRALAALAGASAVDWDPRRARRRTAMSELSGSVPAAMRG